MWKLTESFVKYSIIIYMLPEVVKCGPYLFGDNPKILQQIIAKGDTLQLQSHINSLEDWSQKSLLIFHPNECHVLTLGKCYNITHTERYTLHRQKLEDFFEQKDLDENISVKLKKQNAMVELIRSILTVLISKSYSLPS